MPFWIYGRDARTGEPRDPLFVEVDDEAEARTLAEEAGLAVAEVEGVDRAAPAIEAPAAELPAWEEPGAWPGRIRRERPPMTAAARRLVAVALGVLIAGPGMGLRLAAHSLARPSSDSFIGPREATEWAIAERAYEELGRIALVFGLALILLAFVNWLWDRPRRRRGRRRRPGRRHSPGGTAAGPRPAG